MDQILRTIRLQRQLSLRDVEEQSFRLAQEWGSGAYQISASWLDRLERGEHQIAVKKLMALASIYSVPAEQLLRSIARVYPRAMALRELSLPNATQLLTEGPLEEQAKYLLPDTFDRDRIPDETTLLPPETGILPVPLRRGVIGRKDPTMKPMIWPGSTVYIDTQERAIPKRRRWTHEFERPIYFFVTGDKYVCGWCELDEDSRWLTLIPHPLSVAPFRRWKYRGEIENVGRVVAVTIPLTE